MALTSDCQVMLILVKSIEGVLDWNYNNDNHFFSKIFCKMSLLSAFKVLNDLDTYLLRHCIFKDCLEPDAHGMMSQILSI